MQSQPPPKGSLEELFRHHLLESEAAAVPPRPLVWEHIDNSLLLAQNEKYRRRLLVHRWGMAASLLLAALAGGGWWHSQQAATATLASASARQSAAHQAIAGAVAPYRRPGAASPVAPGQPTSANLTALSRAGCSLQSPAGHSDGEAAPGTRLAGPAGGNAVATTRSFRQFTRPAGRASLARTAALSSPNIYSIAATATSSSAAAIGVPAAHAPGLGTPASPGVASSGNTLPTSFFPETNLATSGAASRLGEAPLDTRLAMLSLPTGGLPAELVAKELPAPEPTLLRRWRYGVAYTIGAFQPNIDFNRSAITYNAALGTNTVRLTQAAAAEYRANLRPGLSQRLGLRATRWLGGHWSLSTGLEVAQQDAYSATSAAFTGEQLADAGSFSSVAPSSSKTPSRELQESSFRYHSAGIPLELQYDNQAKSGLSFYGRVGAIVSALMSVRSEVAGNAEATRTYTLTSASTPYRRLTALLRGSAGVRYRPAGRSWGVHAGPTAEAGVQSLNAETDHSFLQQQRPYSVGLEAGFEFGGFKPVPVSN